MYIYSVRVYEYECTYICMDILDVICIFIHIFTCIYIHIYTNIYMYTHIYMGNDHQSLNELFLNELSLNELSRKREQTFHDSHDD